MPDNKLAACFHNGSAAGETEVRDSCFLLLLLLLWDALKAVCELEEETQVAVGIKARAPSSRLSHSKVCTIDTSAAVLMVV